MLLNQIEVKTSNVITDVPNDVNVPEPELDSPVVIPDEVADEIFKTDIVDNVKADVSSNDSLKVVIPEPKTGTCNLCGKTMLSKNLRYAHPKVCKNRPPPEAPPPPPPSFEQVETIVANRVAKAIKEVITQNQLLRISDNRKQKSENKE